MVKKKKTPKNRLAKSAKYSEYKLGKLLECFAADVGVKQAAVLTKMSERTVRDRYAEWRGKLLEWSMEEPDRFNGFGHLLLNADGAISLEVLTALIHISRSAPFQRRLVAKQPRFRAEQEPALAHVLEFVVRSFTNYEPAVLDHDFKQRVHQAFVRSRVESYLLWASGVQARYDPQSWVWKRALHRLPEYFRGTGRRFYTSDRFLRDIRHFLRKDVSRSRGRSTGF